MKVNNYAKSGRRDQAPASIIAFKEYISNTRINTEAYKVLKVFMAYNEPMSYETISDRTAIMFGEANRVVTTNMGTVVRVKLCKKDGALFRVNGIKTKNSNQNGVHMYVSRYYLESNPDYGLVENDPRIILEKEEE